MRPDGEAGGEDGLDPVFGPDGHLDEGAAHAFVDGALSDADAARVVLHLSACDRCAALVAEARGLVAAASGVLRRLDDGPGAVAVLAAAPKASRTTPARREARPWFGESPRAGARAAAAALVVAAVGGSAYVASRRAEVRPVASASDTATAGGAAAAASAAPLPPVALLRPPRPAPPTVRQRATPEGDSSTAGALASTAPAAPATGIVAAEPRVRRRSGQKAAAPAVPTTPAADAARPTLGVVAGEVRDASGRPIAAANVFVPGTRLAALTDSAGRFTLSGVPAGSATVRAGRIGFFSDSATVAIVPEDTARARLELSAAALSLNQVVVTGTGAEALTAGPARRERRLRRSGPASPALGCFAVGRERERPHRAAKRDGATPTVLRLAPGGLVLSSGTERGAWTAGGDSLVITWADSAVRPLRLRREGDRWAGGGASLTPTSDATTGCAGP